MTKTIILIGLGGGIGSILRYMISMAISKHFQTTWPLGTLAVNIIGCLIIGILLGLFENQQLTNPDMKFLFITGFCGGFTTFSTFASENISLFQSGNSLTALLYIAISVVVSILAVSAGMAFTKAF